MSFGNRARPPEEGGDHGQAVRRALPGGWSRAARRASGHPAQGSGGRRWAAARGGRGALSAVGGAGRSALRDSWRLRGSAANGDRFRK